MKACAERPYADRDNISPLDTDPIYEFAGKQAADSIENGEERRHGAIFSIGPMELGLDKLLVG